MAMDIEQGTQWDIEQGTQSDTDKMVNNEIEQDSEDTYQERSPPLVVRLKSIAQIISPVIAITLMIIVVTLSICNYSSPVSGRQLLSDKQSPTLYDTLLEGIRKNDKDNTKEKILELASHIEEVSSGKISHYYFAVVDVTLCLPPENKTKEFEGALTTWAVFSIGGRWNSTYIKPKADGDPYTAHITGDEMKLVDPDVDDRGEGNTWEDTMSQQRWTNTQTHTDDFNLIWEMAKFLLWQDTHIQAINTTDTAFQRTPSNITTEDDIYVFGDIHGSYSKIKKVLTDRGLIKTEQNGIVWTGDKKTLVTIGDYVHKNDELAGNSNVLRMIQEIRQTVPDIKQFISIIGNHDVHEFYRNPSPDRVLQKDSYQMSMADVRLRNQPAWKKILSSQKFIQQINGVIFTHAGLLQPTSNFDSLNNQLPRLLEHFTTQVEEDANRYFNGDNTMALHIFETELSDVQKEIVYGVQAQWLHDERKSQFGVDVKPSSLTYCKDIVEPTLHQANAHAMVVGHYFPSSNGYIFCKCNCQLWFIDLGMYLTESGQNGMLVISDGGHKFTYKTNVDGVIGEDSCTFENKKGKKGSKNQKK
eukprot:190523_1